VELQTITPPLAPGHRIAHGRAGLELLSMVLTRKFADHLPLHPQGKAYVRERIKLNVSARRPGRRLCGHSNALWR
jgi:hypothetical protein